MDKRTLFLNEELHRYTDELNTEYISTTTLIGKYTPKFTTKSVAKACEKIGRNPNHPKYSLYAGKSAWQIEKEWKHTADVACENGTAKHLIAETGIKEGTRFKFSSTVNYGVQRLFTVNNLLENPNTGLLDLNEFNKTQLVSEFPLLYNIIKAYGDLGYKIYSEVGVYHPILKVSGLIDAPLFKGTHFTILDWKTNKDEIRFESGYFEKDLKGNTTSNWISKDEYFKFPLHDIPASTGHKYAMQLSIYAWLLEQWGFTCDNLLIGHITKDLYTIHDNVNPNLYGKNKIKIVKVEYMKSAVELLMEQHRIDSIIEVPQMKLF